VKLTDAEVKVKARQVQLDVTQLANRHFTQNPMEVPKMMLWCEDLMFKLCAEQGLTISKSIRQKASVDVYVDFGHKIQIAFLT